MVPVLERLVIRRRLNRVAHRLARRDVAVLSPGQRERRAWAIAELNRYRRDEGLPRNTYVPGRTPVFEDDAGRRCAVAHLVAASGRSDLVVRTRTSQNLARIQEMRDPELFAWAEAHGLSADELAEIQPFYSRGTDHVLQLLLGTVGLLGLAGTALVVMGFFRRRVIRLGAAVATTAIVIVSAVVATVAINISEARTCGGICYVRTVPRGAGVLTKALWASSVLLAAAWIARLVAGKLARLRASAVQGEE